MDAVVPAGSRWCCTSSMVTTLLCCRTGSTGCPLSPTGVLIDPVAAVLLDLIGCWFPLRRLKLICSSPGVKSTCTLISRVDLDSADGVRAHNFWMYCTLFYWEGRGLPVWGEHGNRDSVQATAVRYMGVPYGESSYYGTGCLPAACTGTVRYYSDVCSAASFWDTMKLPRAWLKHLT